MKLTFRLLSLMCTLFLGSESVAQRLAADPVGHPDTLQIIGTNRPPQWVVKVSPLALIDVEGIWRADVERLVGNRFSIQGGLGYGNQFTQPWRVNGNTNNNDRETWRAQAEWRVYTKRERGPTRWRPYRLITSRPPLGNYFAIESFYKQVNAQITGTLQRGCETGTCQFFEQYSARAIRFVTGFHLKAGRQYAIRLSEDNNRLLIDYYMGFGMRWRWFEQRGIPPREDAGALTVFRQRDPTSDWGLQAGRFPSFALGIQVGYAF